MKNEITSWENIPKVKYSEFAKQESITLELKAAGQQGIESKSIQILSAIEHSSTNNLNNPTPKKHGNLYNLVADRDLLTIAYNKLSKNKGALTPGVEKSTADGTSQEGLKKISQALLEKKFIWSRTKRVWIPKPGRKEKRPLGLPDFSNKLVQESLRMVLQAIYEPEFKHYNTNHGFRPKCSCSTAIDAIVEGAEGTDYAIEGDINAAYPSMDHNILMNILKSKISDKHLLNLIRNGLKSGLLEEGVEKDTIVGVTQGSIVSPLLFNIYMHEFDKYIINELIPSYQPHTQPPEKVSSIYETLGSRLQRAKEKIEKMKTNPQKTKMSYKELLQVVEANKEQFFEIRSNPKYQKIKTYFEKPTTPEEEETKRKYFIAKKLPGGAVKNFTEEEKIHIRAYNVKQNTNYRNKVWLEKELEGIQNQVIETRTKILEKTLRETKSTLLKTDYIQKDTRKNACFYSRYADDWVLFIRGTKPVAEEVKQKISEKLKSLLKFELSPHKTKVTNLREEKVLYLGFEIFYQKNPLIFSRKIGETRFNQRFNALQVHPDTERLKKRFLTNKIMDNKGMPKELGFLSILQDHEIITKYNQKMMGVGNFYIRQISYPSRLNRWHYCLYYSCIKTLATKHKLSTKKVIERYGYKDISITPQNPNKTSATDRRIVAKYKLNNENKYSVLLNYKEFMMEMKALKNKNNPTPPPLTIDVLSLKKINYRTAFKITTACACCGSKEKIENHHIRPLKHSGGKFKGFNGFDKLVAALGRKQIPVCKNCHTLIHNGSYNGKALNDLYDVRLVAPEGYIQLGSTDKNKIKANPNPSEVEKKEFVIDEKFKTYFNQRLKNISKKIT